MPPVKKHQAASRRRFDGHVAGTGAIESTGIGNVVALDEVARATGSIGVDANVDADGVPGNDIALDGAGAADDAVRAVDHYARGARAAQ